MKIKCLLFVVCLICSKKTQNIQMYNVKNKYTKLNLTHWAKWSLSHQPDDDDDDDDDDGDDDDGAIIVNK